MMEGGMAIVKLNATEAALSLKPVFCACKKKKRTTSNKGMPWKPGRNILLLFLIMNLTGDETMNLLLIRVAR